MIPCKAIVSEFQNIHLFYIGIVTAFWTKQKIKLPQFFRWMNEGSCICRDGQTTGKCTNIPWMHLVTCDLQDPV